MATFTLQSPGKATSSHDVALETAPVADIEHDVKSIPDSTDGNYYNLMEKIRSSIKQFTHNGNHDENTHY